MSELEQDFSVGVIHRGHYNRARVVMKWTSEMPMEFRLHMWEPTSKGPVEVIRSISRDLLDEVSKEDTAVKARPFGMGDVTVSRIRFPGHPASATNVVDWVHLHLATDAGLMTLTIETPSLAAFVRSSLAMCPTEDESLDLDAEITQFFNAEEAES